MNMNCCACLKAISDSISTTESCLDSTIAEILHTHLNWISVFNNAAVCKQCWSEVFKFHQYYQQIKVVHHNLMQTQCAIKNEIVSVDQASESYEPNVKEENEWLDEIEEAINPIENDAEEGNIFCETLKNAGNCTQDCISDIIDDKKGLGSLDNDNSSNEALELSSTTGQDIRNEDSITSEPQSSSECNARLRRKRTIDYGNDFEPNKKGYKKDEKRQSNMKIEDELIRKYIPMGCDLCTFVGVNFTEMRYHFLAAHKHVQAYIMCCGRKLNKRFKIVQHAYKHEDPEHFKCKECNKIFADNNILKTHWLANHAPEEKLIYACDQCPKRFSRQHFLDLHKPSHIPVHERKYPCEQCPNGKPFASEHLLQIHINMRHKRATNVCHVCAKEIRDKQAFEKHVRLHFEDSGPRVKCPRPDCDRWLKDEDNLKQHLRRHNDEGNTFVCSECGKSCKNRRSLRSHLKYSHNDEVFTCEECQKTFKKAISLREHMAQHTGEPLYQCPFCPRTFNSNANMHAHKKRIHPIQWDHWRKTKRDSAQKVISNKVATTILIPNQ